jgi:hypothetical protein
MEPPVPAIAHAFLPLKYVPMLYGKLGIAINYNMPHVLELSKEGVRRERWGVFTDLYFKLLL